MGRFRRIATEIRQLLQNRTTRNILFLSLLVAVVFPLINVFYIYPLFSRAIIDDVEKEAIHFTTYTITSLNLQGSDLSDPAKREAFLHSLQHQANGFALQKVQVFASDGETLYSSNPAEIGLPNDEPHFYSTVSAGQIFSNVTRQETISPDGQKMKGTVVETYVPLMEGDTFLGAVKTYYDITSHQQRLNALARHSTFILGGVGLSFLVIITFVSYRVTRAETARRQTYRRYRTLFDGVPVGLYRTTPDGHILDANLALIRLLHYPDRQTFLATNAAELYIHPEDRVRWQTEFDRRGDIQDFELQLRCYDGDLIWVRDNARAVRDAKGRILHYEGSLQDITERKQAQEALRKLKDFNERILQSVAEGIALQSTEGYFIFVNTAMAALLQYTPEELQGQHWTFIVPPDQHPLVKAADERRLRGISDRYELELLRKDGSRLPVLISGSPYFEDGQLAGFLAVFTDISERKKSEQELAQTNRELEQALRRAEEMTAIAKEANRAKSDFLANMSHEIRTPMNGIIGMAELALGTELTAEQRDYLSAVQTSAESLLDLLNDILDLSKIEAGRLELEEIDFDLRQIVEQLADIMAQRASQKGLELILHIHPDVPAGLRGDPLRLRQIFVNLVGNAIKFTDAGEIVVQVALDGEPEEERVNLLCSVRDTGIGIPADKLDSIFEGFAQADGSITRRYGGTGLGLTISRQLVSMMGGRMWVESKVGHGSTFYFTISLKRSDRQPENPLPVTIEDLRVLIVDDNATNRQILRETLRAFGCQSDEAKDGKVALRKLIRAAKDETPFDLVLLDVQMPNLSGLDVLQTIRQHPYLHALPVILLTSVDNLHTLSDRKDLDWSAYLTKPIKQSQLLDTMMNVIGIAALGQEMSHTPPAPIALPDQAIPPLRILLAEDNEINRKLAKILLERAGHQVILAENGRLALERLAQEEIDLIFMDVQMPEMDGLEATAAIRADERWANIPIIAMTAHAMKGDRERFLAAGMDDYITKPIRAREVFTVIARQMRDSFSLSPLPASADTTPPTDIFNPNRLNEWLDGDQELINDLLNSFMADTFTWRAKLAQALQEGNAAEAERLAHSIKGAAANLGANRLSRAAYRLERVIQEEGVSAVESAMNRLVTELETLQAHLADRLAPPSEEKLEIERLERLP